MIETPTLLITDDDRGFRETLRGAFEPRGFRTLLAEDGAQAIDIVQSESVHVMLIDMHMPRLNGIETMVKVLAYNRRLPWILVSGALTDNIVADAKQAQAHSIISKPVRIATLRDSVNQAMKDAYPWNGPN